MQFRIEPNSLEVKSPKPVLSLEDVGQVHVVLLVLEVHNVVELADNQKEIDSLNLGHLLDELCFGTDNESVGHHPLRQEL